MEQGRAGACHFANFAYPIVAKNLRKNQCFAPLTPLNFEHVSRTNVQERNLVHVICGMLLTGPQCIGAALTMSSRLPPAKEARIQLGAAPKTACRRMKNRDRTRKRDRVSAAGLERPLPASEADIPHILTVKEAAYLMGVHPKTIRRWIDVKILKARKIGKIIRIRRVPLEALFDAD